MQSFFAASLSLSLGCVFLVPLQAGTGKSGSQSKPGDRRGVHRFKPSVVLLLNVKGAFLVATSRRKSNVLPAVSSLPQCTGGTTTQKALLYIQGPINIFGAAAYARFCKRRHGGKTCCRLAQLPICNKTRLAHAMLDITHAQTAERTQHNGSHVCAYLRHRRMHRP